MPGVGPVWEKHCFNSTEKLVLLMARGGGLILFLVVYARSALQFLPPSPPMVPSNADIVPASLSLNQQDIRNYIRRLIPSPSPEPTPARGLLTQPSVENLAPIAPIDLVAEEEVEVVWPTDSSSPTRSPRSVSRRIDGIGGLHKINAAPGKASAHPPEKRIIPLDEDGSHAAKKNVISIPVFVGSRPPYPP